MKYSFRQETSTARSGVPLGGIGTGGVEYRPDGRFYDWNIFNNFPFSHHGPKGSGLKETDAYFALRVKTADASPQVRILSTAASCPEDDPYMWSWVKNVQGIDYEGRFPFARAKFRDDNLPVRVRLEAFSPFIPHDLKNSSIPGAVFTFTVRNPGDEEVEASLSFFVKNGVLYDQPNPQLFICEEDRDGVKTLLMGADGDAKQPTYGTMAISCDAEDASTYSGYRYDLPWEEQFGHKCKYWHAFRESGELPKGVKDAGQAGVVSCKCTLGPGEKKQVRFYLGWHFPNLLGKEPQNDYIGHFYNTYLSDAGDAIAYLKSNLSDLRKRSKIFCDMLYESSVAEWFADPINSQLTTLVKSAWYGEDGKFAVWEGLGCCGLQTIDVGYYGSIPIALFFPELEKRQMLLSTRFPKEDGRVPHLFPGTFEEVDETGYIRIDMIPQWVLMLYRDYLWFNDRDYLAQAWQFTKNALEYLHKNDEDGDGLPNNHGVDQTYDVWKFYGSSAYVGCLYIAALKAAVEMAKVMGEENLAQEYAQRFDRAQKSFVEELWNGEYFILWNDVFKGEKDEGIMAGALDGQWYAHLLDMGYILPQDMVQSHLASVMAYNFDFEHGLLNGAYPEGTDVPEQAYTSWQVPSPWTGTEYAVASHLMDEGMYEDAVSVVLAVDERYRERCQYWDHIECGGHYYRAMVSWALLLSFAGQRYDATNNRLTLTPAFPECKFPLVLPGFFGECVIRKDMVDIRPVWGKLELASLVVRDLADGINSVSLGSQLVSFNERLIPASEPVEERLVDIVFCENLSLTQGKSLRIL